MDKTQFLASVLSLEIDFNVKTGQNDLVDQSLNVLLYCRELKWDPEVTVIVRECEAKVEMSQKNWQAAFDKFK